MGAAESDAFSADLGSYRVLEKQPENNLTFLAHAETEKEYLLRELTFNDEPIYKKHLGELQRRQSVQSEHLTHLGSKPVPMQEWRARPSTTCAPMSTRSMPCGSTRSAASAPSSTRGPCRSAGSRRRNSGRSWPASSSA